MRDLKKVWIFGFDEGVFMRVFRVNGFVSVGEVVLNLWCKCVLV